MKRLLSTLLLLSCACIGHAQEITRTLPATAIIGPDGNYLAYPLDINQDSLIDYTLYHEAIPGGSGIPDYDRIFILPNQGGNLVLIPDTASGKAKLLDMGTLIDGNGLWAATMVDPHWLITAQFITGVAAVNRDPFACKYIGLQFKIGGLLHFGWLALEKDVIGARKLRLTAVGYDASPGQTITTSTNCTPLDAQASQPFVRPNIYPNPFSELLQLDFGNDSRPRQIHLYDAQGKVVYSAGEGGTAAQLDLRALPPGFYGIQITHKTQMWSAKILKQ